ncbi:hypothetical protein SAMN04489724_2261 [Algoriphagus locisalis]|uniref:Uncharacterized protein n=1 Tax=Algoriphagus locisalis TaxID=305507 RepID=A0A1I7BB22_9BACT|nr:hypothetical protein SAMN04489724_2261 [Algoriphagus locisalis]
MLGSNQELLEMSVIYINNTLHMSPGSKKVMSWSLKILQLMFKTFRQVFDLHPLFPKLYGRKWIQ